MENNTNPKKNSDYTITIAFNYENTLIAANDNVCQYELDLDAANDNIKKSIDEKEE